MACGTELVVKAVSQSATHRNRRKQSFLVGAESLVTEGFEADAGWVVNPDGDDTSTGADQGQDGVASLVRPFVAAGARAVVANLWAADDTFSAALMREFYRELAGGADIGESLRRAKLRMIESFGPEALPKLWSGVLAYGDAAAVVASNGAATHGGNR